MKALTIFNLCAQKGLNLADFLQPKYYEAVSADSSGYKGALGAFAIFIFLSEFQVLPSQTATETAVLRSHETMALITPGSAAVAFPASVFSQPARVLSCFFDPVSARSFILPFWMASTVVDTMNPML